MTDVPASLEARMQHALAGVADAANDDDAARYADAALASLRDALRSCDERGAALPLLAADALITAACEHADPAALERMARELSPSRLAELVR